MIAYWPVIRIDLIRAILRPHGGEDCIVSLDNRNQIAYANRLSKTRPFA